MKKLPEELSEEYKEFKLFCNLLRCPLCGSQLDGNIHPKRANLYCVLNNNEYSGEWFPESDLPRVETINYYYTQWRYEITSVKVSTNDVYNTVVNKMNMDNVPRYQVRERIFEITGPRLMFFRKRMEEDVFVNKLKLYTVFV